MEILLENFGKIKKSVIKLDGLTLIAGQNDTGKSTVGKCLFALIKSIYNYEQLFIKITEENINSCFFDIISPFLREYQVDEGLKKQLTDLKFKIRIENEKIEIKELLDSVNIIEKIVRAKNTKEQENILLNINRILQFNQNKETFTAKEKLKVVLDTNIFYGTFFGNLNNSAKSEDVAKIIYRQNESNIVIDLSIENNNFTINEFNVSNLGISSSDITFIETPLYLEEWRSSNSSYSIDLLKKKDIIKQQFNNAYNTDILKEFETIFGNSSFIYSNRMLKYKVNVNSKELMIHNIASGSKSFGLLYLLLKTGVITKDSLLVLDEPENHLHPAWQIEYAKILCKMISNGYYVLITSHSPYFIEALKNYSIKEKIFDNKTNFYIAEKIENSNYSTIENIKNVDGNFEEERIFKSLYEPFDILEKVIINE